MPRPELGSLADEIYEDLSAFHAHVDEDGQVVTDEDLGWPLYVYLGTIAKQAQEIEDLVRDTDAGLGWTALYDVDRTPRKMLPFLAQHVGVGVPAGLTEEEARTRTRSAEGFNKGTPAALRAAVQRFLTGTKAVTITERYQGSIHRVLIVTYEAETPDPQALEDTVRLEQEPPGVLFTFRVDPGWSIGQMEAYHAGDTLEDLENQYGSLEELETIVPPEEVQ